MSNYLRRECRRLQLELNVRKMEMLDKMDNEPKIKIGKTLDELTDITRSSITAGKGIKIEDNFLIYLTKHEARDLFEVLSEFLELDYEELLEFLELDYEEKSKENEDV